ncbi:LPS export ABC transporter permease LptG [Moraxella nasovis]|uniref:LPS export ABC transporter permease LptG n=1 Tax=Moraxella nasovis TaxID=2904121 RepID=UPI001F603570|nr:LPS export ABC transporter permease LptG [Moraxella nasovis]UNU74171.1 LPS export ABC transporter permease LptG [Moraxella nasovis]
MRLMILPRYVMTSVLLAMLGSVVGLWLLQMVFAYLSELENLSDAYTFKDAFLYILYRSPYFLVQFIPTGVLLGSVLGLGMLATNSELISMRAAGLGLYRIISWAMIPAMLFVFVSLGINQFALPAAKEYSQALQAHRPVNTLASVQGYWSVLNTPKGQDIVYISYADSDGKLGLTKRYSLDANSNLSQVVQADFGVYNAQPNIPDTSDNYTWQMHGVHQTTVTPTGVQATALDTQTLALPIAPSDVRLLTLQPDDMSLTDLQAHARLMNYQGRQSLPHQLSFWQKLLSPFSVLSLVLVASSFVFGSFRHQSLGLRIVMALLTGLLFSYLTDLSGFIALATGVSPLLMVLLPIIISAIAGVYLLNQQ